MEYNFIQYGNKMKDTMLKLAIDNEKWRAEHEDQLKAEEIEELKR